MGGGEVGPWTGKVVAGESVLPSLNTLVGPEPHSWSRTNPGAGCGGGECSAGGRIFDYLILTLCFLPMDERPGHAW